MGILYFQEVRGLFSNGKWTSINIESTSLELSDSV